MTNPQVQILSPVASHPERIRKAPAILFLSLLYPPNRDDMVCPQTSPRLGSVVALSASRAIVQSSPTRRSASLSLSRVNPTRGPPSSLPRLMRSVTTALPSGARWTSRQLPRGCVVHQTGDISRPRHSHPRHSRIPKFPHVQAPLDQKICRHEDLLVPVLQHRIDMYHPSPREIFI